MAYPEYTQFKSDLAIGRYTSNPFLVHDLETWIGRQLHYPYLMDDPFDSGLLRMYFGAGTNTLVNFNIGLAFALKSNPYKWIYYSGNPLFTLPIAAATPTGDWLLGPGHVYYDGTQFKMYCTGYNSTGSQSRQLLFTSIDGFTWTFSSVVIAASGDESKINEAGYIIDETGYYCYYTWRGAVTLPSIRVATSPDGVVWTKHGDVITLGSTYDKKYIEGCQALKLDDRFVILYSCYDGTDATDGTWRSALAYSDAYDGPFTKDADNPIFGPAETGWDSRHIATLTAKLINSNYFFFYQGTDANGEGGGGYNNALWDMGMNQPIDVPSEGGISRDNVPSGTVYTIPITVNKSYVSGLQSNFPYQIDLSSKLASDSTFKSLILTRNNISVYDPSNDEELSSEIKIDLESNKLLVCFNGEVDATIDKIFWICVGPSIDVDDDPDTFFDYIARWGLDEFEDGDNTSDSKGSYNGTVIGACTIGVEGKFGNMASTFGTTGRIDCGDISELNSPDYLSLEFILYLDNSSTTNIFFNKNKSAVHQFLVQKTTLHFYFGLDASTSYGRIDIAGFNTNAYNHVVCKFRLVDNSIEIYVNGSKKTVTITGTPTGTDLSGVNFIIGHTSSSAGGCSIDEAGIIDKYVDSDFITTRYKMFFESSFYTIGDGELYTSGNSIFIPSHISINGSERAVRGILVTTGGCGSEDKVDSGLRKVIYAVSSDKNYTILKDRGSIYLQTPSYNSVIDVLIIGV